MVKNKENLSDYSEARTPPCKALQDEACPGSPTAGKSLTGGALVQRRVPGGRVLTDGGNLYTQPPLNAAG